MASINYDIELRRAGAKATHGWRKVLFFARRYVLGTIGLLIMVTFVLTALLADLICRYDPLTVDLAQALLHPDARHWMGTDSSAATSGRGSSMVQEFRWRSGSVQPRSAPRSASSSV